MSSQFTRLTQRRSLDGPRSRGLHGMVRGVSRAHPSSWVIGWPGDDRAASAAPKTNTRTKTTTKTRTMQVQQPAPPSPQQGEYFHYRRTTREYAPATRV